MKIDMQCEVGIVVYTQTNEMERAVIKYIVTFDEIFSRAFKDAGERHFLLRLISNKTGFRRLTEESLYRIYDRTKFSTFMLNEKGERDSFNKIQELRAGSK